MPKKTIQDVIPPSERKSIRNIQLPNKREASEKTFGQKIEQLSTPLSFKARATTDNLNSGETINAHSEDDLSVKRKRFLTIPTSVNESKPPWRFRFALIGGILVALALVYLGFIFLNVSAEVTIIPKSDQVVVSSLFTAKKNAKAGNLPFETISVEDTQTNVVPATGEKKVENRATGRVVIYNDYNSQTQKLVKNTRLQTSDGLIFRIDSSVVVPGQTKKNGKTLPGSVEVLVSADTAGEEYNIPLSDFTVPGFKGDPRYEKFYARSKTVMAGGFKGSIKTASTKDIESAKSKLTTSLKEALTLEAKQQTPSGFILYDSAIYISFESLSAKDSNEIKIHASLHGIIFSRDVLAAAIAKVALPDFGEEAVTSETLANLKFQPDSLEIAPWETGNLPFNLSGTTTILWIVDKDKIQKELAGVSKNEVQIVFKRYKGVKEANVELRPAWKSTLPSDSNKIKIVVSKEAQ